ncbi:hypothetical protein [Desulfatitalea alkaliphila]|uniref:Uncharacterized protein n=1 Tax=Desulfatitalea alkaliphila TaxID=2929485 RepID=A0AA41R6B2_9BACT|nr:hypothetical protein [Desulfatitalea alkaliphila]MCJ8501716.1 hypothetical protein [Desulfatitalea alkaliphila]
MTADQSPAGPPGADDAGSGETSPPISIQVVRSRPVQLTPPLDYPSRLQPGDELTIPLFDGEVCRATIRRVAADVRSSVTVTADVRQPSPGTLVAATTDGRSLIQIDLPGEDRRYRIVFDEGIAGYRLDELAVEVLPGGPADPLIPPASDP